MDEVHKQAEKIRQEEESRPKGNFKDIVKYEWKKNNTIRVFPPWSSKGFIAFEQHAHFNLPPNKSIVDCLLTWPDRFKRCPVCDAIDEIKSRMPDVDVGRIVSRANYHAQVVDREEEDKGLQLCRMPPTLHNELILMMDHPRIGNITDPEEGFDITVDRTEKNNFVDYSSNTLPGNCPIHSNKKTMKEWLDSMIDLDALFKPRDERVAEVSEAAAKLISYYIRDAANASSAGRSNGDNRERETKSKDSSVATPDDLPDNKKPNFDPNLFPKCFAGLDEPEPHSDGSVGFNDDVDACLSCRVDFRCMAVKSEKGL
jgi:hypothetical protein